MLQQESISMQQAAAAKEHWDLHHNYQVLRFHCVSLLEDSPVQRPSKTSINNILATQKPHTECLPADTNLEGKRSIEAFLMFQK